MTVILTKGMVDAMIIKAKKGLALLLALVILVSLFSVTIFNVTAIPTVQSQQEEVIYEVSGGASVEYGIADASITGSADNWAYATINTALPTIKMKPSFDDNNEAYFAITNGVIASSSGIDYTSTKGLVIKLVKNNSTLEVNYYDTASSSFKSCGNVENFEFNKVNEFSWNRNQSGYAWRISINGKNLSTDISNLIYEIGSETTFTFFNENKSFKFENVELNGNVSDSFTEMIIKDSLTVGGNSTNGYTLSSTNGSALAAYNQASNFESTQISFKVSGLGTASANHWFGFIISSSYGGRCYTNNSTPYAANDSEASTGDSIFIGFKQNGSGVYVANRGPSGAFINITNESNGFDYNAVHTLSFVMQSGKWYLCLDGKVRTDKDLTPFVSKLAGKKAFYTVSPQNYFSVTDVKIQDLDAIEEYGISADTSKTVSGDEVTGYSIKETAASSKMAGLKTSINLKTQGVQFKNSHPDNRWSTLVFSSSKKQTYSIYYQDDSKALPDSQNNVLRLMVKKNTGGNYMELYYYGATQIVYGRVYGFKWDIPHTYNFVKAEDGLWDVLVDGKDISVSAGKEADHQSAREAISPILDKLAKGRVYFQFGNESHVANYENLKRINFLTTQASIIQSGDSTDGYTITDSATNGRVKLMTPISLATQSISFKQDSFGEWAQISFSTNNKVPFNNFFMGKASQVEYNNINLQLIKAGNNKATVKCLYYNVVGKGVDQAIGDIEGFDWNKAHTFGFAKNGNGDWVVTVDGKQPNNFKYTTELKNFLNTQLAVLSKKNTYVQFGTYGTEAKTNFSQIKINDIVNVKSEDTRFYYTYETISVSGNSSDGYGVYEAKGNKFAGFKDGLSINSQSISLLSNVSLGKKAFIGFSNSYKNVSGYPNTEQELNYDAIGLLLKNSAADTVTVYAYYDDAEHKIGEFANYDWSVPHAFGFKKIDGKWNLTIDGVAHFKNSETAKSVMTRLSISLNNLSSKKAYVILGNKEEELSFSKVKVVENTAVKVPEMNPFRCDTGIDYSGFESGGYTLIGFKNDALAGYRIPLDLSKQSIRALANVPLNSSLHLCFSNTYGNITTTPSNETTNNHKAISLMLNNTAENEVTISIYYDGVAHIIGKLNDFMWDYAHTYGFTKNDADKWCFMIDGIALEVTTTDYQATMEYITPYLNELCNSKKAYVQLGVINELSNIKRIKIIDNANILPPEEEAFDLHTSMFYDGNSKDGYTLIGTEKGEYDTVSGFTKPLDITTQSIFLCANVEKGNWAHIGFSNVYKTGTVFPKENNEQENYAIALMIRNLGSNKLSLAVYYDDNDDSTPNEHVVGTVRNFNWDNPHGFGFQVDDNGNWDFLVDGRLVDEPTNLYNTVIEHITPLLNSLRNGGKTYVQLALWQEKISFSQINAVNTEDIKLLILDNDDFGDWDDSWDLTVGANDDDDDWEFDFDGDFNFDFGDEGFDFENEQENQNEANVEAESESGGRRKKVTYITKKISGGLTTLEVLLIVGGCVLATGAITAIIIILIKRKKKKASVTE